MIRFRLLIELVLTISVSLIAMPDGDAQERPDFCIFPYRCPTAARISPQVGQQGTEVTLLLQGARLQHIEDVLFYQHGLEYVGFKPVAEVPDDIHQQPIPTPPGTAALLTLKIHADCPLGEHFLRIRTRDDLSEMLSFWVTPYPCVAEKHRGHDSPGNSNGSIQLAQAIEIGTSVYGYHPKNSTIDHDVYAVELKKDQRLTVEVWSSCLGYQHHRGMSDIAVTVFTVDGERVAYADDSSLRDMDPLLSMTAPGAGTYYVDIHQNMDFEGILRHYVAHISDAARPAITYPAGGTAGTTLHGALIYPDSGPTDFRFPLPQRPGLFEKSIVGYHSPGTVVPNLIQVSEFPDIMETTIAHNTPGTAQRCNGRLPVAINGRIDSEGETDWYRINARKGDRFRIRTYAATLGSSMDARLQVRPAPRTDSRINISVDDSRWIDHDWWGNDKIWIIKDRMDPIAVFEPDADGDYLVGINDAQRLFGPDFIYRIEFQPVEDQAFIYFPTDYREAPNKRDRLVIPRGNTIEHTLAIIAGTGNRYRGGMQIEAVGLPDGVTFHCPPLQPGQTLTQATLKASPTAESWTGLIDLVLKPTEPETKFTGSYVHNVPSTQRRGGNNVVFNRVRKCAVAVVQEAPFRIQVKQPKIGLAQNAIIDLNVEVERRPDFHGAVRVFAAWMPEGVTVSVPLVIPPGETRGTYRMSSSSRAVPGNYPITLTAHEEEGGDRGWGTGFHYVASPPINLSILQPYLDMQITRTAIERRSSGTIHATIRTINPLPGDVKATLVRLPKGVELINPVMISPGDTEVTFPVRVTADCLVGQYKEIGCEIAIKDDDQTITQQTGNGTLRIDAERGAK